MCRQAAADGVSLYGTTMALKRQFCYDSLLLILVAAALVWPLFQTEYFDNWMSIDGAFIGDVRFLSEHLPSPGWVPYVYCGNRFDYLYPPAMRYGSAFLVRYAGFSPARAYHFYSALVYCLSVAGIYILVRVAGGARIWAVLAALGSLALSPSLLIFKPIRDDSALHMPQRLNVIVKWGEVPHMSALAILLFALAAAWLALPGRRPCLLATAALLNALCVSNNFYGATALAVFFPLMVWTLWLAYGGAGIWRRAAAIAVLSYALAAFWLTPSYLALTAANLKLVAAPGNTRSRVLALAAIVLFAAISFRLGHRKPERAWPLFLGGALGLFGLSAVGAYYFNFHALGDPVRFVPEFDILLIIAALECLRRKSPALRIPAIALIVALLLLALPYLRKPWGVYVRDPNPGARIEYRLSEWLVRHLPGARVYTASSLGFWQNVWHDVAQVGGISDQGMQNQTIALANWQIRQDDKAQRDIYWLQSLGADAIVVHGKRSREIYHAIAAERKFHGLLEVLYDSGEDDIVYRVPRRFLGLARVVERQRMEALPKIEWINENESQLLAYAQALEQGPDSPASSEWMTPREMRIRARVREGESVAVQVTYDTAWHAYAGTRKLPVSKDVMGFMRIDPPPGEHEISLRFETPLENRIGRVISLLALLVVVFLTAGSIPSKRTSERE
jgi:hypothetical protein